MTDNELALKDRHARFALLKAMVDQITAELADMRAQHGQDLVAQYEESRTSSWKAVLPDGDVVANVALDVPKSKVEFHDDDAFIAWARENHAAVVETEEIPEVPAHWVEAVPARTVYVVPPKAMTAMVKQFTGSENGTVVDKATGTIVAGVKYVKGATPSGKFSVTYVGDGREHLVNAYQRGELNTLLPGTGLPALAAPQERRMTVVPAEAAFHVPSADRYDFPAGPGDCGKCGVAWVVGCACEDDADDVATIDDPTWDPGGWDSAPTGQTGTGW